MPETAFFCSVLQKTRKYPKREASVASPGNYAIEMKLHNHESS
jgi:hypothetical protein